MRRINKDGYIDVKNRKGLSLSLLIDMAFFLC
jgi:hypothetical protein